MYLIQLVTLTVLSLLSMSPFITKGASGGETEGAVAPNRLEINDFVKNEEMFSLYIQALSMWFMLITTQTFNHRFQL